jgi:hypothetical protein
MKENVIKNNEMVINTDGELLYQERTTNFPVGNEPPYFKVYTDLIDDLSNLVRLNQSEKAIFLSLAKNMSFNNTVVLLKPIKEIIMRETGISSINTINKGIDNLFKRGFLIRQARSVYLVNPNLVGKGKWEDNKALRLTIEYSESGRDIEVVKISPNMLQLKERYHQKTIFEAIEEANKNL